MDVAHQLPQVRIFLAEDRLISILKEMAVALMATVEPDCIAGKQATHNRCDGFFARTKQKMCMVRDQCPRVARGGSLGENLPQARQEIIPVCIVPEDVAPLYPPNHDVVD